MKENQLVFLGTGTSQGVPVIACDCVVCKSSDLKDKRLRTSVYVEYQGLKVVVDTGPDFRQQMLAQNIQKVDAVLFTHEHKDHIAGLDDIRAFNFKWEMDMPVYAESRVQDALKREFHYVFSDYKYPGIPQLALEDIVEGTKLNVNGVEIEPLRGMHYKLPVFGFRFGDLVYLTDMNSIAEEEKQKMKGADILVVNALRKEKHVSHFNLEEALELIEELKPKRAFLTHLSHLFGKHDEEQKRLPDNVKIAYDGLRLNF